MCGVCVEGGGLLDVGFVIVSPHMKVKIDILSCHSHHPNSLILPLSLFLIYEETKVNALFALSLLLFGTSLLLLFGQIG